MNNLAQLEALLFVAGTEGITIQQICIATSFEKTAVKQLVEQLSAKYHNDKTSALEIKETQDGYRLVTKSHLGQTLKGYFESAENTKLTQAQLETLVIIAYKQPITRIEIDQIRGVQSTGPLKKLMIQQLITEVGRKDEPGRPILFGTSDLFLDYFGLHSLLELPPLPDIDSLDIENNGDLFDNTVFETELTMKEEKNNA
ncbi:SMC-Scp complex subunit ScpB [Leuconostoc palmae]|uniref:SMC-Scp complex subunit ScpB n=1 Tax=Leuconostoc palmae TaxID=501487 RepID=UPI001C7DB384|nr:SMC-Scp complex subunit ScpB [Leuconostoc palmae]